MPTMEHLSDRAFTDDALYSLMAGMMQNHRDALDRLIENKDTDFYSNTRKSRRAVRDFLVPVVELMSWLSQPDAAGLGISFNSCCEYLKLDPDLCREKFIELIKRLPHAARKGLAYYTRSILSDDLKFRKHIITCRGKD